MDKKIVFGNTGLSVCPLIFGTLPLGPLQAGLSAREGGRLIRHGLERGINLLDTAELYGTYGHIRAAVDGLRGELFIASKTHATDAATARSHLERALREMGREYVDIFHLHAARLTDPLGERKEVWEEILKMKEEGKVRHAGVSTHLVSVVEALAGVPEVEVVHPLINRTGMGIIGGDSAAMAAAIAACAAAGKGIYAMKALAGGNLISAARDSLTYVKNLPGVQGVAVGMLSSAEIDANYALFAGAMGKEADWERLQKRHRHLRIMDMFCNGCGACVAACTNKALFVEEGRARLRQEDCILCGYCAAACPNFLIRVV
ncbi:MAG: 4Fe-4S binding protein [Deltaproteobacteria bacterium]|nr:4Fe-4S binding protein [Deltaproteobacteria bacterium]